MQCKLPAQGDAQAKGRQSTLCLFTISRGSLQDAMPAPSKTSFQPPVLRSEAQMRALRSATTSGLIEEYQARKQRVYAHFHSLRSGAQKAGAASAAHLADIDHQQTRQISALNQELDNKLACLLVDAGPGPALEHAGSAAAAYAQWASAVLGARQAQGQQPTHPPTGHGPARAR